MRQVFCNPELNFAARGALRDVLAMHQIAPDDAVEGCVEVHFDAAERSIAGRVLGDMSPDHPWQKQVQEAVAHGRLSALKTEPHALWSSIPTPTGKSRVGGAMPQGFALPEAWDFASGYGFVGSINAKDPGFAFLPHDIHLIWPFFCDYHPPLFVDIADPLRPHLIPPERCTMLDAHSGEVMPLDPEMGPEESDEIGDLFADAPALPRYEAYRFDMMRARAAEDYGESDGVHAGVPIWVQYPEIPLDPETASPMRFLCQITAQPRLSKVTARPEPGSVYHPAFEKMDFWGAGVLFVFVSDSARTCCLLAQNT